MIMHRELLSRIHHDQLFRVLLGILLTLLLISIADRKESHPLFLESVQPSVGDVPSKHVIADLIIFMPPVPPVLRLPVRERGKMKPFLPAQLFHILDNLVDLRSFHRNLLPPPSAGGTTLEPVQKYLMHFACLFFRQHPGKIPYMAGCRTPLLLRFVLMKRSEAFIYHSYGRSLIHPAESRREFRIRPVFRK